MGRILCYSFASRADGSRLVGLRSGSAISGAIQFVGSAGVMKMVKDTHLKNHKLTTVVECKVCRKQ